jgi:hypothetical protein
MLAIHLDILQMLGIHLDILQMLAINSPVSSAEKVNFFAASCHA